MIAVPAGVRVLVATKPVDFRRGADSLAALAREELQRDPFSGVIIVFVVDPMRNTVSAVTGCGASRLVTPYLFRYSYPW